MSEPSGGRAAEGARQDEDAELVDGTDDPRSGRLAKVQRHRAQIRAAARRAGATRIEVFGSVARGQDGPDSDVDFLVDLDVRVVGLLPLIGLTRDLEEILGERVDVASRPALGDHVAPSALDDAVVV
ncbi:nucleotidyltransferase family protein [Cellulomonas biazotea]|uniref:Polymerase nucleotidyl transferase domain-containing protein n=1 Tax=Cellulomonas biazotea TaxID=1709 RepID=A0A402DR72_9CELL|nr:nucleotidyltransferase domain-containing protein [Cellulomonas biazotea]GCE76605.1 hypothetical protein CBZ_16610 [Cellulomonas biazotea]